MAEAPGISARAPRPNRAARTLQNSGEWARIEEDDDIVEAVKRLYPQLENQQTADEFKKFLEILTNTFPRGDRYIAGHKDHLHALYASFNRLKSSFDEQTETSVFKLKSGGKFHIQDSAISFEPAQEQAGKYNQTTAARFTKADAYDLAMLALHSESLRHPNKIEIVNASVRERAMIQAALIHVQKEFLPKGEKFQFHKGLNPISMAICRVRWGTWENFGEVMATRDHAQRNIREAENAVAKDPYTAAKNLLLTNSKKFEGRSFLSFAEALQKEVPDIGLDTAAIDHILDRLEHDKFLNVEAGDRKLTNIVTAPKTGSIKYNKLVADIINNPHKWEGKDTIDISKFIYGNRMPTHAETEKLEIILEQLQEDKIIHFAGDGKIDSVFSALAGTDIAKDFEHKSKFQPLDMVNNTSDKIVNGVVDAMNNRSDRIVNSVLNPFNKAAGKVLNAVNHTSDLIVNGAVNAFNTAARKAFVEAPAYALKKSFEGAKHLGSKAWNAVTSRFIPSFTASFDAD